MSVTGALFSLAFLWEIPEKTEQTSEQLTNELKSDLRLQG
jgi:hypothetical protein